MRGIKFVQLALESAAFLARGHVEQARNLGGGQAGRRIAGVKHLSEGFPSGIRQV